MLAVRCTVVPANCGPPPKARRIADRKQQQIDREHTARAVPALREGHQLSSRSLRAMSMFRD